MKSKNSYLSDTLQTTLNFVSPLAINTGEFLTFRITLTLCLDLLGFIILLEFFHPIHELGFGDHDPFFFLHDLFEVGGELGRELGGDDFFDGGFECWENRVIDC